MGEPGKRHAQQQRLVGELLQPSLVAVLCVSIAELVVPSGLTVDQRVHAELLRESLELTRRCGALHEVHEMSLHPPLGEEPERFTRVCVFLHAKDLNVHTSWAAWGSDVG